MCFTIGEMDVKFDALVERIRREHRGFFAELMHNITWPARWKGAEPGLDYPSAPSAKVDEDQQKCMLDYMSASSIEKVFPSMTLATSCL